MSKILLLEDDLSLNNGLSFVFKKQGFELSIARTLKEAEDHIDIFECSLCYLDHVLAQLVFCLVDTWGIKENDLTSVVSVNGLDPVSGRLRLIRSNCDLLTDQVVHQCGFSNIRSSDDRNKT